MKLLHLSRGTQMDLDGAYRGYRDYFDVAKVQAHLNGEIFPLGFNVVTRAKASFLCVDIDKLFKQRLPIVVEELRRRGWHQAAFYTNGSSEGKGKVIITLREPLAQARAVSMIRDFSASCTLELAWEYKSDDKNVDLFPIENEGGLTRIGGQHKVKCGPIETLYALDGSVTDLSAIEPLLVKKLPIQIETRKKLDACFYRYKRNGFSRDANYNIVRTILVRLASQIYTIYGNDRQAQSILQGWLNDLARASPGIMNSADSDKRRLFGRDKAWQYLAWIQKRKEEEQIGSQSNSSWSRRGEQAFVSMDFTIHFPQSIQCFTDGTRSWVSAPLGRLTCI